MIRWTIYSIDCALSDSLSGDQARLCSLSLLILFLLRNLFSLCLREAEPISLNSPVLFADSKGLPGPRGRVAAEPWWGEASGSWQNRLPGLESWPPHLRCPLASDILSVTVLRAQGRASIQSRIKWWWWASLPSSQLDKKCPVFLHELWREPRLFSFL